MTFLIPSPSGQYHFIVSSVCAVGHFCDRKNKILFYYVDMLLFVIFVFFTKGDSYHLGYIKQCVYVCSISESLIRCVVCLSIYIMLRVYNAVCTLHCERLSCKIYWIYN